MPQIKVASLSEISPGNSKVVSVADKTVALFNVENSIFAIENTCPHRGGPLGEGMLEDSIITCPWHGWQFNVKDGSSPVIPGAKINTIKVILKGDDVYLDL